MVYSNPVIKYRSYSHTMHNELGDEEIRIEYHNGFLRNFFHLNRVTLVFVKSPLDQKWYHKYIGVPATKRELREVDTVFEMLRQRELYKDHINEIFI